MKIRETRADEVTAILALYPLIFPDEDLRPVVSALLAREGDVVSLAAFESKAPVGHILFTFNEDGQAALLGPLGILPDRQRKGTGTALVEAGFARLRVAGVRQVFVLGDTGYYGRFGFAEEQQVTTPCPIPAEWRSAWQSLTFAGREPLEPGTLRLPEPWLDPALWSA